MDVCSSVLLRCIVYDNAFEISNGLIFQCGDAVVHMFAEIEIDDDCCFRIQKSTLWKSILHKVVGRLRSYFRCGVRM
jgi:hypothetical protein